VVCRRGAERLINPGDQLRGSEGVAVKTIKGGAREKKLTTAGNSMGGSIKGGLSKKAEMATRLV